VFRLVVVAVDENACRNAVEMLDIWALVIFPTAFLGSMLQR
jgi:hypothetical protein